jgi:hypothetical protein
LTLTGHSEGDPRQKKTANPAGLPKQDERCRIGGSLRAKSETEPLGRQRKLGRESLRAAQKWKFGTPVG